MPLFHIAGIGNMLPALTLGIPTVIHPLVPSNPAPLDVLAAEKVKASSRCQPSGRRSAPNSVRGQGNCGYATCPGGGPGVGHPAAEMAETFHGCKIIAAFGQTEMSPVTCMLLGEDAIRKLPARWQGHPDRRGPDRGREHERRPSARSARSSTARPP